MPDLVSSNAAASSSLQSARPSGQQGRQFVENDQHDRSRSQSQLAGEHTNVTFINQHARKSLCMWHRNMTVPYSTCKLSLNRNARAKVLQSFRKYFLVTPTIGKMTFLPKCIERLTPHIVKARYVELNHLPIGYARIHPIPFNVRVVTFFEFCFHGTLSDFSQARAEGMDIDAITANVSVRVRTDQFQNGELVQNHNMYLRQCLHFALYLLTSQHVEWNHGFDHFSAFFACGSQAHFTVPAIHWAGAQPKMNFTFWSRKNLKFSSLGHMHHTRTYCR